MEPSGDVVTELRVACAQVAQFAEHVRIVEQAIAPYAESLENGAASQPPSERLVASPAGARLDAERARPQDPKGPSRSLARDDRERLAAQWLTLDAVNFGSGWFPTLRKREGRSGYFTIAAGLTEHGPWSAEALTALEPLELARVLGQDPDHELMALFARSLRDLGRHIANDHEGSFAAAVDAAGGSAVALAELLGSWDSFADASSYAGFEVPFLKRAQIAAADLHRAGVIEFHDLARLTMFADNLVPHVLRLDGILEFDPDLVARIEREELIAHGSPEEVEIRACAVHAVELIAAAWPGRYPAEIDELLWNRGQEPRYKASPRHRSRCTAY